MVLSMSSIKCVACQYNFQVDNVSHNFQIIEKTCWQYKDMDLIIFPELALTGYMPLDRLYTADLMEEIKFYINKLIQLAQDTNLHIIVGTPFQANQQLFNVALVIGDNKIKDIIYKEKLIDYHVFCEHRYFQPKPLNYDNNIVVINEHKIAIFVCEDLWYPDVVTNNIANQQVDLVISINASPMQLGKMNNRFAIVNKAIAITNAPCCYLNLVGGVDEVLFDGNSFINDALQRTIVVAKHAQEDVLVFEINKHDQELPSITAVTQPQHNHDLTLQSNAQIIYEALVLGLRNFLQYLKADGVILGISGGIDSALTAAIVNDAIGDNKLCLVSLPSTITSTLSLEIIQSIKTIFKNAEFHEITIDSILQIYQQTLSHHSTSSLSWTKMVENLQSRIRGDILMGISNSKPGNWLVLTTGNKSELATGYCTLYGDTCGAYNVLKDIYKTQVFELAKWRNQHQPRNAHQQTSNTIVIPNEAIQRKPSAELTHDQFDEEKLMDYATLDKILIAIIEYNKDKKVLYSLFDKSLVDKAINLLNSSQYKRQQSAPGVNINHRPFAKDFKYNIISKIV